MHRILVATWAPGGNLPPLLAAARLLAHRGHRVYVLASGSTGRKAANHGCNVIVYRHAPDPDEATPFEEQLESVAAVVAGEKVAHDVADAINATNANLVVADCMLPAAVAAAAASGCRTVSLVHFLYGTMRGHLLGGGRWWPELLPHLNATRHGVGLDPVRSELGAWETADRLLVTAPRWLDANIEYPRTILHAGPLGVRHPPAARRRASERAHVLLSFSTTVMPGDRELMERVCAAIGPLDVDATLTLGGVTGSLQITPPKNVRLLLQADHDELLPISSVVISHGGLGTVLRALAHGVPNICLPLGREQPVNAQRIAELGAGVQLPAAASSAQIRSTTEIVLRAIAYRTAARWAAQRIVTEAPDERAADFLERAA